MKEHRHDPRVSFPSLRAEAINGAVGWITLITASLILSCWYLGIADRTILIAGELPMMPNAALCYMLSGGALLLLRHPDHGMRRTFARIVACLVLIIAMLTLGEYGTGRDLSIDGILLREAPRMHVISAASLTAISLALALLSFRSGNGIVKALLVVIGGLLLCSTLVSIIDFITGLYRIAYPLSVWHRIPAAALLLNLLLAGSFIASAWARQGDLIVLSRPMIGVYLLTVTLIVATTCIAVREFLHLLEIERQQLGDLLRIEKFHRLQNLIDREEDAQRGYLITGDREFFTLFRETVPEYTGELEKVREMLRSDPSGMARLSSLESMVTEWRTVIRGELAKWEVSGLAAGSGGFLTERGQRLRDRIRAEIQQMIEDNLSSFSRSTATSEFSKGWTLSMLLARMIVLLIVVTLWLYRINGEMAERYRAEQSLVMSETRLRLAAEASSTGIWDWNIKEGTLHWDETMFRIYGFTPPYPERLDYAVWRDHVHPDDLAEQEREVFRIRDFGGQGQRTFRVIREGDRAVRSIRASDVSIPGPDGRTARIVGVNVDITETVKQIEQIGELNNQLRKRAAELEGVVGELDAFSYSVSHDLRAPLRAVDGFSHILEEDYAARLDDEGRRLLGVIRSEAQRMDRLITDLLSFSRLSRQKAEAEQVDMRAMAAEVFEDLMRAEKGRKVRLDLGRIPPATGTPSMIRQLWVNLIGNAIKFTGPREAAEIRIGAERNAEGEDVYFVGDNGVGFDMRYADKLFGVFSRLHKAEEFPGTGVGLALVQRIVRRHGGRVWGEGEVGKGAVFRFTLSSPAKETAQQVVKSTATPS